MSSTIEQLDKENLAKAATIARGLSMDAVAAAGIGHLGLPLGAAEMGAVLYGSALALNPDEPKWMNRDRFILSAGHGSMFLYGWLHLSGYPLSLEEVKNFRQLHSITPGHPEFHETPGVEATTGPLGQGVGNSVGYAIAAKMREHRYNTADHTILDHHIVCLAGDGCLQEGVAREASALAGHLRLDNLILIFDSNDVTLDNMADKTQSEDFAKYYEAIGWEVQEINGHDMDAFRAAYDRAKANTGKPQFIIAKTEIGRGIPEVAGTHKAHGESGKEYVDEARKNLGLPEEKFYVSDEVKSYFAQHKQDLLGQYNAWLERYKAWKAANPTLAEELEAGYARKLPSADELLKLIPEFAPDTEVATRKAGSAVLQPLAQAVPRLISGSADLHGSTNNYIKDGGDFGPDNPAGRNILFGIREHAMGSIVNGFGYDGYFIASGATFTVFSDYLRPTLRLAAMSKLPNFQIFTHDSPGVGEDGPTHQPIEHASSMRLIPFLDVIRPGDPEETAGAFVAAIERADGPTALVLTRQNIPILNDIPVADRRQGVLKGGYIARREQGPLELIIMATGSELHLAMQAAEEIGAGARVVSMPCCERFDRQSAEYQEEVLPKACRKRVAMEAGATAYWWKYVGLDGAVVGIDRYGLSAPGKTVLKELGITKENLVSKIQSLG